MIVRFSCSVLVLMVNVLTVLSQTPGYDIDAEISRLRRELAQLRNERARNNQDFGRDKAAHEQYLKEAALRRQQALATVDSLRQAIVSAQRRSDSLGALIEQARANQRQSELQQDRLRTQLLAAVKDITTRVRKMPPMLVRQLSGPVSLIEAELTAKTLSNEEALNRIYQILLTMEEATGSIQVLQETSPVADIRGAVYRLRVGTIMEAITDAKGERCVIWDGYDDKGVTRWREESPHVAKAVLKAANVREGKALPALVSLPLK